jgi:DNA processing protein
MRVEGNLAVLEAGPLLAVVGTRTPTKEILRTTRRVVEIAGECGMVVLSGISPGVDAAAHEAALEQKLFTVAVPGCGLETLFSSDRGPLARRIVSAGGLLVSPFPADAPETSARRSWRNRIIAALCHGLLVVASEPEGGAWEAQQWAGRLERRIIEPAGLEETE